jgi:hypothetical protein
MFPWDDASFSNCVDTISVLSLGGISNMYAQDYDNVLTRLQSVRNNRMCCLNALFEVSVVLKMTP